MSSAFNIPAGWREVVESLVRHIEVTECQHEDTYRGGAIWTICRDCDRKWADGRGGFKPYLRPAVLLAADKLLAAAPTPPVDAVPGEPVVLNLLREAVATIDTLPGYPKGADLCDRIEAYLAASVASRAGSEPVAANQAVGYVTQPIKWKHRQSETVVKVTRDPQLEYGFVHPIYASPSPQDSAPIAPAAAAEPSEKLRTIIRDAVAANMGDLYVCGRVWSAWSYGTMSEDDFAPAGEDEDVLSNITDAVLAALSDRERAASLVVWPTMPPSKGQSPVLFEDGYAEGWAKCLAMCKAALEAHLKRWLWLRAHSFVPTGGGMPVTIHFGAGVAQSKPELLDAAIDRASAGEAQS